MTTKKGRALSDADLARLAVEAEAGYDLSTWRRRRGRPGLTATSVGSVSPKIEARVPADLRREIRRYAAEEGKTVSEVVRDLAMDYVQAHRARPRSPGR